MGHNEEKDEGLIMSGRFVFPPSQHENLPLESENTVARNIQETGKSFDIFDLKEDNWNDKALVSIRSEEDDEYKNTCEAWWKKRGNSFWSIFVAAAVVGIVVLGRRLHPEKLEALQHKLLSFDSEKMKRSFGSITHLKSIIECGSRSWSGIHDIGSKMLHYHQERETEKASEN